MSVKNSSEMQSELLGEFKLFFKRKIEQGLNLSESALLKEFFEHDAIADLGHSLTEPLLTWKNELLSFEKIKHYLQEPAIREIILSEDSFFIERAGILEEVAVSNKETAELELAFKYLVLNSHQEWNLSTPFTSFNADLAFIPFRVTLAHSSLSPQKKFKAWIRKIGDEHFELSDFTSDKPLTHLLSGFVKQKKNILVAGATGSGKTTCMKTMINHVESHEHIVVIEDAHELNCHHKNTTFLLKSPSSKAELSDFCAYALRMRPDRIILGEIRSKEVVPFVLSMNTGHKGMISSLHADSAQDAISRMALLFALHGEGELSYERVHELICKNVEIVIFLKNRKIESVIEIIGQEDGHLIFNFVFNKSCQFSPNLAA